MASSQSSPLEYSSTRFKEKSRQPAPNSSLVSIRQSDPFPGNSLPPQHRVENGLESWAEGLEVCMLPLQRVYAVNFNMQTTTPLGIMKAGQSGSYHM